jgi:hypothetical protein
MERVVLTFHFARAKRPARSASAIRAALAASVVFWCAGLASAHAQVVISGGCLGSRYSINCTTHWAPAGDPYVRLVPQPLGVAAIARAKARERRWVDRCRPTLAPDRYGVSRYRYVLPGCEFGVGED